MTKRLLSLFVAVIIFFTCSAEFRWGPTAGVNISTLSWKQRLVETNRMCGFNGGVMGEVMIPGIGFGVDFALKYVMHGATVHFGDREIWASDGIGTEKVMLHTLQLPLNLRFKWTRMDGFEHYLAPFVYGGPVFTFNLSTSDVPCIEHPEGSASVQCGFGVELLERFQVSGGYMWGLSYDCRTKKLDNFSARMNGWQVNVAFLF